MAAEWLLTWKLFLASLLKLTRCGVPLIRFFKNISLIEESREQREIENAELFLKTIAATAAALKKHGMPDAAIRILLETSMVPLVQAQADAMILKRALLEGFVAKSGPAASVAADSLADAAFSPALASVPAPARVARRCPIPYAGIERRGRP